MIIFCWNARGAASLKFAKALKEYYLQYKPDLVAIQETRCSGRKLSLIKSIRFNFYIIIDANGFSGGIWLMWNNPNYQISEVARHNQTLHIRIKDGREERCLTIAYAHPQDIIRKEFRIFTEAIARNINCLWMICGDFNDIGDISEKKCGSVPDRTSMRRINEWKENCSLIDMGFYGSRFTWRGPMWQDGGRILKRLDRALCNQHWRVLFNDAVVETLSRFK
ncbi:uncharacterized protein [Arachis hypogaea]|uniref:uncharacterized protein n=1 Tax=Arachis hypogaea TaxID=3818 RepID=UPI003B221564